MINEHLSDSKKLFLFLSIAASIFTGGCNSKSQSAENVFSPTCGGSVTDITDYLTGRSNAVTVTSAAIDKDGRICGILYDRANTGFMLVVYDPRTQKRTSVHAFPNGTPPQILSEDDLVIYSKNENLLYVFGSDQYHKIIDLNEYSVSDPVYSSYDNSILWVNDSNEIIYKLSLKDSSLQAVPSYLPYYGNIRLNCSCAGGTTAVKATDLRDLSTVNIGLSSSGHVIFEGEDDVFITGDSNVVRYCIERNILSVKCGNSVYSTELYESVQSLYFDNGIAFLTFNDNTSDIIIIKYDESCIFSARLKLDLPLANAKLLYIEQDESGNHSVLLSDENKSRLFIASVESDKFGITISDVRTPYSAVMAEENASEKYRLMIESKYGISVLIGEDAKLQFPDYSVDICDNDERIMNALYEIESALSLYPDEYFRILSDGVSRGIVICLTGYMHTLNPSNIDNPDAFAVLNHGLQFIAINIESCSNICKTLCHEITHATDKKIAAAVKNGSSNFCDLEWNSLNPDGFEYYYSYIDSSGISYALSGNPANTAFGQYSDDENVYFVDSYSKTFPSEDRARLMEIVMSGCDLPDYIYGTHIQAKLQYYFSAIRDVFGYGRDTPLYWERALHRLAA